MRRLAALVMVLVLVPAAVAAAASGKWTTHRASAGFSVDAPSTWIDVTKLTPELVKKSETLPALQPYIDLVAKTKSIKLMLVDVGPNTIRYRYATNMNVVQTVGVGTLELLRTIEVAQLKATGLAVSPVRSSFVTLPSGRALQLSYRARYTTGPNTVALVQYLMLHDGEATALTFATLPKLATTYRPLFLRSARSFRYR